MVVPLCTWILKSSFDAIPRELVEAGLVDGCNHWQTLLWVVLPLTRPGLVAVSVVAFFFSWNEYLFSSALITRSGLYTGSLGPCHADHPARHAAVRADGGGRRVLRASDSLLPCHPAPHPARAHRRRSQGIGPTMKITKVETIWFEAVPQQEWAKRNATARQALPNNLWVRIHTDTGLAGLGESYYLPRAVASVIHDVLAPLLLGRDPRDIENHWSNMFGAGEFLRADGRRDAGDLGGRRGAVGPVRPDHRAADLCAARRAEPRPGADLQHLRRLREIPRPRRLARRPRRRTRAPTCWPRASRR